MYEVYWKRQPREAVSPGPDGWVTYGDARIKLIALGPASDLEKYSGEPFTPPPGVAAWKAIIAIEATAKGIGACRLSLEDDAGRTYEASPSELSGSRTSLASCLPDGDPPPTSYRKDLYFATPASARPVAVRITLTLQLPRYARLTAAS